MHCQPVVGDSRVEEEWGGALMVLMTMHSCVTAFDKISVAPVAGDAGRRTSGLIR